MNANELTLGISALANGIADKLSDEDLELVSAIFSQLGDTLATIAVVRARNSSRDVLKTDTDSPSADVTASDKDDGLID